MTKQIIIDNRISANSALDRSAWAVAFAAGGQLSWPDGLFYLVDVIYPWSGIDYFFGWLIC